MNKPVQLAYRPRNAFLPFHARKQDRAVLIVHRRGGKTVACVNDLAAKALYTTKPDAHFAYVGPYKNQTVMVAWKYLLNATEKIPGRIVRKSEKQVEIPNRGGSTSIIALYGADNPDALRGTYFDGIVLDECADFKQEAWDEVIQPCLSDRDGWAVCIGTPKGKNFLYHIYEQAKANPQEWFSMLLKASESGLISKTWLEKYKNAVDPETYEREYECSFLAGIKGAFYLDQMKAMIDEGRTDPFDIVNSQPVHCVFDLGWSDATAVCFVQLIAGELRVVDYEEWNETEIDVIIREIKAKGYKLGQFWLPHDAKAKSLQTGKSMEEKFWSYGVSPMMVPELGLIDGISATRSTMSRVRINGDKCYQLIENLKNYKKKYLRDLGVFSHQPEHDQASHGADAFRYVCLAFSDQAVEVHSLRHIKQVQKEIDAVEAMQAQTQQIPINKTDAGWTLDSLFKARERKLRHRLV